MTRWTVGVSFFGYYVVEADTPKEALERAQELQEDGVEYNVDGVDWHNIDEASPKEPLTR
jgi:hypothetical protein